MSEHFNYAIVCLVAVKSSLSDKNDLSFDRLISTTGKEYAMHKVTVFSLSIQIDMLKQQDRPKADAKERGV